MNTSTLHPMTKYTVALILASLALIGCKKKQPPPPKPVATVQVPAETTKTIPMPRSQMESHKRLSSTAAANIESIVEKTRAAQGKVTIRYPANTPKAVLQSLQTFDLALEKDDTADGYAIIVTKPDYPAAR